MSGERQLVSTSQHTAKISSDPPPTMPPRGNFPKGNSSRNNPTGNHNGENSNKKNIQCYNCKKCRFSLSRTPQVSIIPLTNSSPSSDGHFARDCRSEPNLNSGQTQTRKPRPERRIYNTEHSFQDEEDLVTNERRRYEIPAFSQNRSNFIAQSPWGIDREGDVDMRDSQDSGLAILTTHAVELLRGERGDEAVARLLAGITGNGMMEQQGADAFEVDEEGDVVMGGRGNVPFVPLGMGFWGLGPGSGTIMAGLSICVKEIMIVFWWPCISSIASCESHSSASSEWF
jgi:hypothetical protein